MRLARRAAFIRTRLRARRWDHQMAVIHRIAGAEARFGHMQFERREIAAGSFGHAQIASIGLSRRVSE